MEEFKDPKKSWEIDHEWAFIGIYRDFNGGDNRKTYKCKYCESHYFGETTNENRTIYNWPSSFRPKDSGCQILFVIQNLQRYNEELKKELADYEDAFKIMNKLLNRNKNESK